MNEPEYETMYRLEDRYWWYVGLHDLLRSTVAGLSRERHDLRLLDAGCGTGRFLEVCGARQSFGLELSQEAFRFAQRRSLCNLTRGTVVRLPFADGAFDVVVSADVLCNVPGPEDFEALREMVRVLRPGGALILNLPAYEGLRSHHDAAVHIRQRYTRASLRVLLARAGLREETLTYRTTFLFPVVAAIRRWQRLREPEPRDPRSDLRPLPGVLDHVLRMPLYLENRLIRAGIRLPFGLSVFCVARKPGRVEEVRAAVSQGTHRFEAVAIPSRG